MENNEEEIIIKKIPLDELIDVLIDLYEKGIDYIDIMGSRGENKDKIGIGFCKEYMSEESDEFFSEDDVEIRDIDLSNNDDLNQII